MLLPCHVMFRLCGSHISTINWKRSSAALPKPSVVRNRISLGFAKAKEPKSVENRLKLVIRPSPEDGWYLMENSGLFKSYLQLSKARLTAMVTVTAITGFIMAPVDFSLTSLLACSSGTALLSASANTFNHLLEIPYDAQMKRTQSRLLVIHRLIKVIEFWDVRDYFIICFVRVYKFIMKKFRFPVIHAVSFAILAAAVGVTTLWIGCNPLTSGIGLLNAFLYTGVYTPMKRYSVGCTWVGAVVGALPPLMGYAGATGSIGPASLVLASLLYCWQFPHFNALSWNLRADYTRAGYRVMCAVDQKLCRLTSLRHSVALLLLCSLGAPSTDLTEWFFAVASLPLNGLLLYLSYKFYRHPDAKTSRTLFYYTLLHLPLIMMLMVISKFGDSQDALE
ncbi:unnamed protein product [Thelazia callipaeda]|uniref:Heme O synthase n=1 Tax=Thelazia callipaeda TaxID=103827 RepID=A0A0N5CKY3_THECL|nr:unnamed protein product [Thelazia callipaeda]